MPTRRGFIKGTMATIALGALDSLARGLDDWLEQIPTFAPPREPETVTLREFIAAAWHLVEPATEFSSNWHIDAIAEHLEAVTRGEIRNLLVNIPPRHMKSLTVSVFWPVWSWIHYPETRWLFASYAGSLAVRDALKSRRIIESAWFERRYGHIFRLTGDQNAKSRYDNNRTGYRIATSVAGSATGEGGDIIVVDDPHKAQEAASDRRREGVLTWWDETMGSRLNDPKTGRKVIVMQRVHEHDLAGHVLQQGGYEHLCLPAKYEPERATYTSIGWTDPRTEAGELLWPQHIGPAEIADLERTLGSYGFAGQYQQRPAPRGGGMFKRAWWRRYTTPPPVLKVEQFADTAYKEGTAADYTVIATWGLAPDGDLYLLDLWRGRQEFPLLVRSAHDVYARHKHRAVSLRLTIEDKGSGTSLLQTLKAPYAAPDGSRLPALPVRPFPDPHSPDERDLARLPKIARAEGVTGLVEMGRVYLPASAPWIEDFIAEHEAFPNGAHDDMVDTTVMAQTRLTVPKPRRQPLPGTFGYRTY